MQLPKPKYAFISFLSGRTIIKPTVTNNKHIEILINGFVCYSC